jgi:NADPH:quinone reductase
MKAMAIVMREYGAPEVLKWAEVSLPPLQPGDVRIRTIAAAVNHTDLEIRAGNWPIRAANPFPYTPGVEVLGEIHSVGSAVAELRAGDLVITMMQGLGGVRALRAGAYAEYVDAAASAIAPVPAGIDPYEMAALGLAGITAYEGLRRIGPLEDRKILVSGAAGGVGSAAVTIARAQGAIVTGLISRPEQEETVRSLGATSVVVTSRAAPPGLPADSFDGVLDTVGGNLFAPMVQSLRAQGVLSLVGAVAGGDVAFDAWNLIRPITLTGYSTENLDGNTLRQGIAALAGWLASGKIQVPRFAVRPMNEAADAHSQLEQRMVTGRVLLVPAR